MDCRKWLFLSLAGTLSSSGCKAIREARRTDGTKESSHPRPANLVQQAQQTQRPLPPAVMAPTNPAQGPRVTPKAATEVSFAEFQEREALSARYDNNPQEREKKLDKARVAYKRALEIEPANLEAALGLARVYGHLRDYERAFEVYQKAMRQHPQRARMWYEMGMAYAQCKDFTSAVSCYQKAVDLDRENRTYAKALGLMLARAGRPQEALPLLTRLYGEAKANLNLARMMHQMKQDDQAKAYLQSALQRDPNLARTAECDKLIAQLQLEPGPAVANAQASGTIQPASAVGRRGVWEGNSRQ
jgi:tetratricopeptide (TPR) repeat protein